MFAISDWEYKCVMPIPEVDSRSFLIRVTYFLSGTSYLFNTAPQAREYIRLTFGVFFAELAHTFQRVGAQVRTAHTRHKMHMYIGHDGSMVRLASGLGLGEVHGLRWPAMGSEIVMEVSTFICLSPVTALLFLRSRIVRSFCATWEYIPNFSSFRARRVANGACINRSGAHQTTTYSCVFCMKDLLFILPWTGSHWLHSFIY